MTRTIVTVENYTRSNTHLLQLLAAGLNYNVKHQVLPISLFFFPSSDSANCIEEIDLPPDSKILRLAVVPDPIDEERLAYKSGIISILDRSNVTTAQKDYYKFYVSTGIEGAEEWISYPHWMLLSNSGHHFMKRFGITASPENLVKNLLQIAMNHA